MKEATVARAVDRILRERGAWSVNIHATGATRNGIPDRIAIYQGRPLALELKAPGGRPTRLQQHELDQAQAAGATVAVIHNAAELEQLLDTIDHETGRP